MHTGIFDVWSALNVLAALPALASASALFTNPFVHIDIPRPCVFVVRILVSLFVLYPLVDFARYENHDAA